MVAEGPQACREICAIVYMLMCTIVASKRMLGASRNRAKDLRCHVKVMRLPKNVKNAFFMCSKNVTDVTFVTYPRFARVSKKNSVV